MSSKQPFFEAAFRHSLGTPTIEGVIPTNVYVNLFAKSNSALTIVVLSKLSGADISNSRAFRRKLHSHALPRMSAADLAVISSVKVDEYFSPLTRLCPF